MGRRPVVATATVGARRTRRLAEPSLDGSPLGVETTMTTLFPMIALQAGDDGLTLSEILSSLPLDAASVFVLALTTVAIAAVIWYGRPRGGGA
jgi:hypothetical protein